MKLNKFKIFLLLVVSIVGISSIISYNSQKYSSSVNINDSKVKDNNMLSMMLETSAGSGEYKETTATSWPTDGYEFNETLSRCKNGSKLSYDEDKNQVIFDGNTKDDCYVYFDVYVAPTFANYIKSKYKGVQGKNNLYLHDSTLTNGAGDNSYRYAGSSDTTNNFVCFGYDSTDGTCPTDYLYRIIGVFNDNVKLIKYERAGNNLLGTNGTYDKSKDSYSWDTNANNVWSKTRLNTINLNTNFINNIGIVWANKIITYTWKVGGNTYENITSRYPNGAYQNEIVNPATTASYNAKIGLMYVSDYGYAASSSSWSTALNGYDNTNVTNENWMYYGSNAVYTITPNTNDAINTYTILHGYMGFVIGAYNYGMVLPCFYLNSNVTYVSGSGTKTSPYIIN